MFTLANIKPRKAILLAFISIVPDFDILFGVHRSISHSIIVWLAVLTPVMVYLWRFEPHHLQDILLVYFSACLHCIFDFYGYVPVLWPLTINSYKLDFNLFVHVKHAVFLRPEIGLQSISTDFTSFIGFDAPIFTSEGFIISLALLAPELLKVINQNKEKLIKLGWIPKHLASGFYSVFKKTNDNLEK